VDDEARLRALDTFDLVFAIEVLQYADIPRVLGTLWGLVAPGGRLVAVVPNGNCPIVAKARERFGNNYLAPSAQDLAKAVRKLGNIEWWGLRGMHFQKDQGLVPYVASPWTRRPAWKCPPNRLQLAAIRKP